MTRAELLSLIMHDIGLPLIRAIIKTSSESDEASITERVTKLLAQTTQNNDRIINAIEMDQIEANDTNFRLNLTSLSSKIIASHYEKTGALPTEKDLKRSVAGIEALLNFSENYIPQERLTDAYPENPKKTPLSQKHIYELLYIEGFIPLINAIGTFSFGQSKNKMIQDVSEKLRARTGQIRIELLGDFITDEEKKAAELSILKTLIELYTSCHMQEMNRIMALDNSARNKKNSEEQIADIWTLFEKRTSMLSALALNILPVEDVSEFSGFFDSFESFVAIEEAAEEKFTPMSFYKKSDDS